MVDVQQTGLPLRDAGVPCDFCECEKRRPDTNRCAGCGRYARDPRYAYSKLTDKWYRVTEYNDAGDGKIVAKEKEEVSREEVPEQWIEAIESGGSDD